MQASSGASSAERRYLEKVLLKHFQIQCLAGRALDCCTSMAVFITWLFVLVPLGVLVLFVVAHQPAVRALVEYCFQFWRALFELVTGGPQTAVRLNH